MLDSRYDAHALHSIEWNVLHESPDCGVQTPVGFEVMVVEEFLPLVVPPVLLRVDVRRISGEILQHDLGMALEPFLEHLGPVHRWIVEI